MRIILETFLRIIFETHVLFTEPCEVRKHLIV